MLLPREQKHATEKKALAVKWTVQSLKYYLLGAPFTLVTDHAPLQWLDRSLQPFTFWVHYKKGCSHANADYFSQQGPWVQTDEEKMPHLSGVCVCEEELIKAVIPGSELTPQLSRVEGSDTVLHNLPAMVQELSLEGSQAI